MKTANYASITTAFLLSLKHIHPVFIQTLSSSNNVQDVKRRSLSCLKPVLEKFKPILIPFQTAPIQFLARQLRPNNFLLGQPVLTASPSCI